jgi:hypothetical protein
MGAATGSAGGAVGASSSMSAGSDLITDGLSGPGPTLVSGSSSTGSSAWTLSGAFVPPGARLIPPPAW